MTDLSYFFLVVHTVLNIIKIPPIKIAIASPPAIKFRTSSLISIVYLVNALCQRYYISNITARSGQKTI